MLIRSEVAAMFSSRNLHYVANGDFSLVRKIAESYHDCFNGKFTVSNVFDFCYRILYEEFRNEYFYKNTLANKILRSGQISDTATMFTEFRVGACKADCVIVNGITTCYEIKTEYDNLSKLRTQINAYLKLFDKVNVVVSERYIDAVRDNVPVEVGIILLSRKGALRVVRPALLLQTPLDTDLLMRSLRREEYVSLTKAVVGHSPNVQNTEIFRECGKLIGLADNKTVRKQFRTVMRRTRGLDRSFLSYLPDSLTIAGVESTLSRSAKIRFVQNLDSILCKDETCTILSSKESNSN
jgi:hypothetical protein